MTTKWIKEIKYAEKHQSKWHDEAKLILKTYKGEDIKKNSFNILFSSLEVLEPALFNSAPVPDVRRRYRESDPVAKTVSEIIERSIAYSLDRYKFDRAMVRCVHDTASVGRGVLRVVYEPILTTKPKLILDPTSPVKPNGTPNMIEETDENGEVVTYEEQTGQKTYAKHVQWDAFIIGPGNEWDEVPFIGFRWDMTAAECQKKFGDAYLKTYGKELSEAGLDYSETDDDKSDNASGNTSNDYKQTQVWEIWSKTDGKVIFVSESHSDGPLMETDPPATIDDFYCTPEPLRLIVDTTSLLPIPVYRQIQQQAEELNVVCTRINKIVDCVKVRGMYASEIAAEVTEMLNMDDNQFIPVRNASAVTALGGLEKAMWVMPIDKLQQILAQLYVSRDAIIKTIYDIIGISDILRGSSNPRETATAQNIKAQFGSLRLQKGQRETQRYARDIMRIMGDIICELYEQSTIQAITGLELEPQQWEQAIALMRSEQICDYRVDIETDSTVQESLDRDIKGMAELLTGLSNFFTQTMPLVMSGVLPFEAMKEIALAMVRRSGIGGKALEDEINKMQPPQPAQPKSPSQEEITKLTEAKATLMQVVEETAAKNQEIAAQIEATAAQALADKEETTRQAEVIADHVNTTAVDKTIANESVNAINELVAVITKSQQQTVDALNTIAKLVTAPKVVNFSKDENGLVTGGVAMPVLK